MIVDQTRARVRQVATIHVSAEHSTRELTLVATKPMSDRLQSVARPHPVLPLVRKISQSVAHLSPALGRRPDIFIVTSAQTRRRPSDRHILNYQLNNSGPLICWYCSPKTSLQPSSMTRAKEVMRLARSGQSVIHYGPWRRSNRTTKSDRMYPPFLSADEDIRLDRKRTRRTSEFRWRGRCQLSRAEQS
jgi:hypothetical protein